MLELTGPAGGTYGYRPESPEAEHISIDAVEFCRTLAGRAPATDVLTIIVPFETPITAQTAAQDKKRGHHG
jgi:hypothetical protein